MGLGKTFIMADPLSAINVRSGVYVTSSFGKTGLIALVLALFAAPAQAQHGEIVGRVLETAGNQPVKAAVVLLSGTSHRATTDSLGTFRLSRIPAGRYILEVQHLGYGPKRLEIEVAANLMQAIRITVSAAAISMAPVTVEAISNEERRERGTGYRRSIVTRAEIERAQNTNLRFGEMLRLAVPTVGVRRLEHVGSQTCIELRVARGMQRECLSPAVYLDGVPISNPTTLYDNLDLSTIETLEVVPAAEAGVMFGSGALYGALLITTRRPGAGNAANRTLIKSPSFNWNQDAEGHKTMRVFGSTVAVNLAALALGAATASQCIGLRQPSYDGLISNCQAAPTIGSAAAAILLPALASGVVSRWAGRTQTSQGSFAPAAVGAAMTIVPGYALVFSGYRNDSESLKTVGYGVMLIGAPLITTASDYLFRELRKK